LDSFAFLRAPQLSPGPLNFLFVSFRFRSTNQSMPDPGNHGDENRRRPTKHEYPDRTLDRSEQAPTCGQYHVAVPIVV